MKKKQKGGANSRRDNSIANSRQDNSIANSRQDNSIANSRQDKSSANSRQKKYKEMCKKPKADHEENMKHMEDLHIQHKVNEEFTKNTAKTRTGSFRIERRRKSTIPTDATNHSRSLQE